MSAKARFYLPSLDGFRAIAAGIVFLGHAGLGKVIPGGLGVTIFFFLSGFLITTLLRKEFEASGEISLKGFYLRRIYRILPPMYFVLALITTLTLTGVIAGRLSVVGMLAQLFQFTNYYIIMAQDVRLPPFTNIFWSLAVEEHFYLLLPLSLLLCLRTWNYKRTAFLFLGVCVVVLCWRLILVYGYDVSEHRTYYATDTRLDSLLFGCIMALWNNPALDTTSAVATPSYAPVLALAGGLCLLVATLLIRDSGFRETWRYTLQGIAVAPIFWTAIKNPHWIIFQPLNWKLTRAFGLISYSFYLTHVFCIDVVARLLGSSPLVNGAGAFLMTTAFATLMYFFIEKPFARLKARHTAVPITVGSVAAGKGLSTLGT